MDWILLDEVIRNQLLPDTRTVAYTDPDISRDFHSKGSLNKRGTLLIMHGVSVVRLFDVFRGHLATSFNLPDRIISACFSPEEDKVFVTCLNKLYIVDLMNERLTIPEPINVADVKRASVITQSGGGSRYVYVNSAGGLFSLEISSDNPTPVALPFPPVGLFTEQDGIFIFYSKGQLRACRTDLLLAGNFNPSLIFDYPISLNDSGELGVRVFGDLIYVSVLQRDCVILLQGKDGNLSVSLTLRDPVTHTEFLTACMSDNTSRPFLAVCSTEGSRSRIELLEISSSPTVVGRWDLSKLGGVGWLGWLRNGRGFVSTFYSGPAAGGSVLWLPPPAEKQNNWTTCVSNLRSCKSNHYYPETEEEFDFNHKVRDNRVISRYAIGKTWNFLPDGIHDQVENVENSQNLKRINDEFKEPPYPFFSLDKVFATGGVWGPPVPLPDLDAETDRVYSTTGSFVYFENGLMI